MTWVSAIAGVLVIAGFALAGVLILGLISSIARKQQGRARIFGILGAAFIGYGVASFFAPSLARFVPSFIEWPIGWAGDVATFPSGVRVVAHHPTNRVQVYDADWRFVRGWYADAGAGPYRSIAALSDGTVEIVTNRLDRRYVFDLDGRLVESGPAPRETPQDGWHLHLGKWVPTWPWLLPLSHPFIAFATAPVGLVILGLGGQSASGARHERRLTRPRLVPIWRWPWARRTSPLIAPNPARARAFCAACGARLDPVEAAVQEGGEGTQTCSRCGLVPLTTALIPGAHGGDLVAPTGCRVTQRENSWHAVISMRSAMFFPMAVVAVVWNGILLQFISFLGGALFPYGLLLLPLLGVHAWLGFLFLARTANLAFGAILIDLSPSGVRIASGIRGLRRWRERSWSDISSVRQAWKPRPYGEMEIVLDGREPLAVGRLLSDERREFLFARLRSEHARHQGAKPKGAVST